MIADSVLDFSDRTLLLEQGFMEHSSYQFDTKINIPGPQSGREVDMVVTLAIGGTSQYHNGKFAHEPSTLASKFRSWLGKPWVNIDKIVAVKSGEVLSVSLFDPDGPSNSDVLYNRRGKIWAQDNGKLSFPTEVFVTFSWQLERYDLIQFDRANRKLIHTLGLESSFCAADFMPYRNPERIALSSLYISGDGIEEIDLTDWRDGYPVSPALHSEVRGVRRYNSRILAQVVQRAKDGENMRVANYSDSTGIASQINAAKNPHGYATTPNGPLRNFPQFWSYARHTPEFDAAFLYNNVDKNNAKLTPGQFLAQALDRLGNGISLYDNWAIGSTDLGSDFPHGNNSERLEAMLASKPDIIINSFLMNEFPRGDYNPIVERFQMLLGKQRKALPGVCIINLGCFPVSIENGNPHSWYDRVNDWTVRLSRRGGCAYVPYDVISYRAPGYLGMSRESYAAQNRWNHPQIREFLIYSQWTLRALGLDGMV